jgi:sialate O-acetylesterase
MKLSCRFIIGALLFLITLNTHGQKIKVACVGNSITAGYLLANPKQESYPAQLQQLLGNQYEVGNFGLSGATLLKKGHRPYFKTKEFTDLLSFKADIAIIHLGLNDTDPRNWPNYKDEFQQDYQWLIDSLKQGNAKLKVYVCKLTPIFSGHPRFKSGTREWYWQVQEKIGLVAKANDLPIIDLNLALNNRPELFADNLHPNTTGAGIIASTVYQALTGDFGGFKLHPLFTDHMVLQRDSPIPVYGIANANDQIEVRFNNTVRRTVANSDGKWKVQFPAMKFGGPYQLTIVSGATQLQLKDIMIGDVWFCAGQSNMAFPVKSSASGTATLAGLNTGLPIRLLKFNPLAETKYHRCT